MGRPFFMDPLQGGACVRNELRRVYGGGKNCTRRDPALSCAFEHKGRGRIPVRARLTAVFEGVSALRARVGINTGK